MAVYSITCSKVQTLWEGQRIWKNLPLVLTKQLFLLSSVKRSGRFFQIFVPFSEKLNFNFLREQCSSKETHHQVIYRFICGFVHFVEDTNKGDVRSFTNHLPHNGAKWFVNARTSRLFVSSTKCIKPQINLWITWLCVFLLLHCSVLT